MSYDISRRGANTYLGAGYHKCRTETILSDQPAKIVDIQREWGVAGWLQYIHARWLRLILGEPC